MEFTGRAEDKVASPLPLPPPPALMAQQGSITEQKMDELQSTPSGVGMEFMSTNMDELLRSTQSGKESLATAGVADSSGCAAAGNGLRRQGSLTLLRNLSTKTIDEVWRDLASGTEAFPSSHGQGPPSSADAVVQQPTLREMSLEEFLIRAGVVKESMPSLAPTNPTGKASMGGGLLFDKLTTVTGNYYGLTPGFNQVDPSGGEKSSSASCRGSASNLGLGIGPTTTGVIGLNANGLLEAKLSPPTDLASYLIGKGKDDISSALSDPCLLSGGMKGKKTNVSAEKVLERKHRRMVKNRESAARSRARKRAYTLKLEAEVAKLKQQNEELKRKQEEILEMHNNQAVERVSPQSGAKKQRLRRTLTGPW